MLFCRFCGNKLPDASIFCAYCGSRLQPLAEEEASTSDPHTTMATPTLPPEVLTLRTSPLQADPTNDEEEEEQRILPPVVTPELSATGNVPSVQGVPHVGTIPSVPSVSSGAGTAATTMTAGTMVKVLVIVVMCAAVLFASVKILPPILTHSTITPVPVHKPTPRPSPTPSLSQLSIYVKSQDGNIYAFNASNGVQRWKYSTNSQGFSQLQVANGIIYFIIDDDTNQSSNMYELNVQNGTLLRSFKLPYFTLEGFSFIPNFTVMKGIIYFSSPEKAFALRSSDGTQLWQYPWYGRGASDPVVVNDVVYYVTGTGIIYAFKSGDGTLLWKYQLGPDIVAQGSIMGIYPAPVIINDSMYMVGWLTDSVLAIRLTDQAIIWHTHLTNAKLDGLYAAHGVLYVNAPAYSSQTNSIYALQARDGTQLWSKNNLVLQAIQADTLYSVRLDANGSATNDFYALYPTDGSTRWHIQVDSPPHFANIAVVYTVVYMMTDSNLYALHVNDGSILWRLPLFGSMVGP